MGGGGVEIFVKFKVMTGFLSLMTEKKIVTD